MRQVLIIFTVVFLVGCSANSNALQTVTPSPFISEQQAIEIAIKDASMGHPELSRAKTPPKNAQAEVITLAAAEKRLTGHDSVPVGYDPNMMVWFVSMEGIWTDEFPRPTDLPSPEPYHHFSIILNAKTGETMAHGARP
jgi:hypothetical protein